MRANPRVAIDGAAGVGKSTIGERLAQRLGSPYVDTGAFYRTLTALALEAGIAPEAATDLQRLAEAMPIAIVPPTPADSDGRQYTILVGGKDYTPALRTPAVEAAVSRVSIHPAVRAALIRRMRDLADERGVVMVGRDIGTVVLPDADLKIYLVTAADERAFRRHADLVAKYGAGAPSLETVRREIEQRDAIDAPNMRPADDAHTIDNTALQADEVVDRILSYLGERLHPASTD
jgi:cytidylate kinase